LKKLEEEGLSARIDIKRLRGYRRHYRVRLGNYRIRFELSADQTIVFYSISQRESAYE
jgi:mRNA-degrading endonuclease RelE of RelBE toxin-antitoxin system